MTIERRLLTAGTTGILWVDWIIEPEVRTRDQVAGHMARSLVSGMDLWLNNPIRPHEASGTSGQKAALNGQPNCSILDGWWAEGYNGKNGWAIGEERE